jgi:hypothetical protein
MNFHANAHLPIVPVVAAAVGAALYAFVKNKPLVEIGRALLWGGSFAALFASS